METSDLWLERLPAKFKDRAPKLWWDDEGFSHLEAEGRNLDTPGLNAIGAALIDIIVLWLLILATTIAFWRIDRRGGWLLLPYLIWVGYAAALNAAIWWMN